MDLCLRKPWIRARSRPTCACVRSVALPLVVFFVSFLSPSWAAAAERIKLAPPIGDSGGGTLTTTPAIAGTIVRSANATTVWYLYPGACTHRANGTWTPRTTPLADPIGNSRSTLDNIIASGAVGNAKLLVRWAGSNTPSSPGATGGNTLGGTLQVLGNPSGPPSTVTGASFTIEAQHRALYVVFV